MKFLPFILSAFASVTHSPDDDMQSIKRVFKEGVAAWNRGDIDGHLKSYADLETVRLISGGQIVIGKAAIAAALKSRFPSPELMGVLTLKNLEVKIVTASDALFFGEFQLEQDSALSLGVFTGHLQKFAEGWAIVLDHSSALP